MTNQPPPVVLIVTTVAAVGLVSFVAYWFGRRRGGGGGQVNPSIRKNDEKVRDVYDIEDLMKEIPPGGKISLCRCWRSEKFPLCDGAHKDYNKCTGDNVGPVNIKRRKE